MNYVTVNLEKFALVSFYFQLGLGHGFSSMYVFAPNGVIDIQNAIDHTKKITGSKQVTVLAISPISKEEYELAISKLNE